MSELTTEELKEYLNLQIEEINKFIWDIGLIIEQNPLNILTREEWAKIWIDRHAYDFHNNYFKG